LRPVPSRAGQEPRQFRAGDDPDPVTVRVAARVLGEFAEGHVEALPRIASLLRRRELTQGLDAGARDLPALRGEQDGIASLLQVEVRPPVPDARYDVALGPVGGFERIGKLAPGHRAQR